MAPPTINTNNSSSGVSGELYQDDVPAVTTEEATPVQGIDYQGASGNLKKISPPETQPKSYQIFAGGEDPFQIGDPVEMGTPTAGKGFVGGVVVGQNLIITYANRSAKGSHFDGEIADGFKGAQVVIDLLTGKDPRILKMTKSADEGSIVPGKDGSISYKTTKNGITVFHDLKFTVSGNTVTWEKGNNPIPDGCLGFKSNSGKFSIEDKGPGKAKIHWEITAQEPDLSKLSDKDKERVNDPNTEGEVKTAITSALKSTFQLLGALSTN